MSEMFPVVFLVDVDNTLLDNDQIQKDLGDHLEREFGATCRDRYWKILEDLFEQLGYRDYLGALQRYRIEHPTDIRLLAMSSYLVDYPFADRLYPSALDVLKRLRSWGRTVILSDGDVVFQPRKVERSGISDAVSGHVLIYIHKEAALSDVARRYPAAHYVMVDDKLRILAAMKKEWGEHVTPFFLAKANSRTTPMCSPPTLHRTLPSSSSATSSPANCPDSSSRIVPGDEQGRREMSPSGIVGCVRTASRRVAR
jgi:FMN phosphatase YigB (HAD superfamily)